MILEEDVVYNKTLNKRDRNMLIQVHCDLSLNGNYKISADRQIIFTEDGDDLAVVKTGDEDVYVVKRNLADISTDTVTLPVEYGSLEISAAQLAVALEMFTDKYASEDQGYT